MPANESMTAVLENPDCRNATPPFRAWHIHEDRAILPLAGEPRGRADTPGFDRWPDRAGQQVTEVGVAPLPQTNTHKKPASLCAGFLFCWM